MPSQLGFVLSGFWDTDLMLFMSQYVFNPEALPLFTDYTVYKDTFKMFNNSFQQYVKFAKCSPTYEGFASSAIASKVLIIVTNRVIRKVYAKSECRKGLYTLEVIVVIIVRIVIV